MEQQRRAVRWVGALLAGVALLAVAAVADTALMPLQVVPAEFRDGAWQALQTGIRERCAVAGRAPPVAAGWYDSGETKISAGDDGWTTTADHRGQGRREGLPFYFRDANGNGTFDTAEYVWRDTNGNRLYDHTVDVVVSGTPTAASTGAWGKPTGYWYRDSNRNGSWDSNEDVWAETPTSLRDDMVAFHGILTALVPQFVNHTDANGDWRGLAPAVIAPLWTESTWLAGTSRAKPFTHQPAGNVIDSTRGGLNPAWFAQQTLLLERLAWRRIGFSGAASSRRYGKYIEARGYDLGRPFIRIFFQLGRYAEEELPTPPPAYRYDVALALFREEISVADWFYDAAISGPAMDLGLCSNARVWLPAPTGPADLSPATAMAELAAVSRTVTLNMTSPVAFAGEVYETAQFLNPADDSPVDVPTADMRGLFPALLPQSAVSGKAYRLGTCPVTTTHAATWFYDLSDATPPDPYTGGSSFTGSTGFKATFSNQPLLVAKYDVPGGFTALPLLSPPTFSYVSVDAPANTIPDTNRDDLVDVGADLDSFGPDTGTIVWQPDRDVPQLLLPLAVSQWNGLPVHAYIAQGGFDAPLNTSWTHPDATDQGMFKTFSLHTRVRLQVLVVTADEHLKRFEVIRPRGNVVTFDFPWNTATGSFSEVGYPAGINASRTYVLRDTTPASHEDPAFDLRFDSGIIHRFSAGALSAVLHVDGRETPLTGMAGLSTQGGLDALGVLPVHPFIRDV